MRILPSVQPDCELPVAGAVLQEHDEYIGAGGTQDEQDESEDSRRGGTDDDGQHQDHAGKNQVPGDEPALDTEEDLRLVERPVDLAFHPGSEHGIVDDLEDDDRDEQSAANLRQGVVRGRIALEVLV